MVRYVRKQWDTSRNGQIHGEKVRYIRKQWDTWRNGEIRGENGEIH